MLLNFFIAIISHPFLLILFSLIIFITTGFWVVSKKKDAKFTIPFIILVALAVGNAFLQGRLAHFLIYKYGETGTAVITEIEQLDINTRYGGEQRYFVLLKTDDGEILETQFESWDRNFYPKSSSGWYVYPLPGQEFSVKYMPKNLKLFVILTELNSDYSKAINCSKLQRNWGDLQNKIEFDPENVAYKKTYASSLKNYVESDCEENDFLLEYYEDELFELETGIEALPEQNKEQFESTMPPETQELFEELAEDFAPYL